MQHALGLGNKPLKRFYDLLAIYPKLKLGVNETLSYRHLLLHFQIEFANLKHQCLTSNSRSFIPYRSPDASSVDPVKDHEQIEQRQIDHRRMKETFGREFRSR